jgi:ubiquinone/menaquinone biosynthesis C-methylase UbiE
LSPAPGAEAAADNVTGSVAIDAPARESFANPIPVPDYLETRYWWAYVRPQAVHLFEREWLVNLILFGNYARLGDAALEELSGRPRARTLQVACVYGNLTRRLHAALAPGSELTVVDVLQVQLRNLARKLGRGSRVNLVQGDSTSLRFADASFDQVLLFFLLHEQPEAARRASIREAARVTRPGGRIVVVDYGRPRPWHPLRPLLALVFRWLEPFAADLWKRELAEVLREIVRPASLSQSSLFGGVYQKIVMTR